MWSRNESQQSASVSEPVVRSLDALERFLVAVGVGVDLLYALAVGSPDRRFVGAGIDAKNVAGLLDRRAVRLPDAPALPPAVVPGLPASASLPGPGLPPGFFGDGPSVAWRGPLLPGGGAEATLAPGPSVSPAVSSHLCLVLDAPVDTAHQPARSVCPEDVRHDSEDQRNGDDREVGEKSHDDERGGHRSEDDGETCDEPLAMHEPTLGQEHRKPPVSARSDPGQSVRPGLDKGFKYPDELQEMMSVSSPCEICGRTDVEAACDRCGQLVCERHFEDDLGFCADCAAQVGGGRRDPVPSSEDLPDGVDTYRF